MKRIPFDWRGIRSVFIGSKVLADAFFFAAQYVHAFSAFEVEGQGAKVLAFFRVNDHPILLRHHIFHADHVLLPGPSVAENVNTTAALNKNGRVLINRHRQPERYRDLFGQDFQIFSADASAIAEASKPGSASNFI